MSCLLLGTLTSSGRSGTLADVSSGLLLGILTSSGRSGSVGDVSSGVYRSGSLNSATVAPGYPPATSPWNKLATVGGFEFEDGYMAQSRKSAKASRHSPLGISTTIWLGLTGSSLHIEKHVMLVNLVILRFQC